ncbi:MAG: AAA family ATPase [Legionellales bacterium]|nr:AAA family ATPase [Legionellales bacterium]
MKHEPFLHSEFEKLHTAGLDLLDQLRAVVTAPDSTRHMRTWGISDVAKLCNTSVSTIKKYEKEGLLPKPDTQTNKTQYKKYTLSHINLIRDKLNTRYIRPKGTEPMIIGVSNFKGGSCKSTTSCHLVQYCAIHGLRCLHIDCDPQGTSTWVQGSVIPDLELDFDDTLANAALNPTEVKKVIRKTYVEGVDVICSNMKLQDLEFHLSGLDTKEAAFQFSKFINIIKDDYDVIVFDCGPNVNYITLNVLTACNSILAPLPPDMTDVSAFISYLGTLDIIFKKLKRDLRFFKILLTRHKENKDAREVENALKNVYPKSVLYSYLVDTIEVSKASNAHGTIFDTSKPRGSSKAFQRALLSFNTVFDDLLELFKNIWETESSTHHKE